MKIGFDVRNGAGELLLRGDVRFGTLALLENGLSFLLVLPKSGIIDF
jgi:hypothetical protein